MKKNSAKTRKGRQLSWQILLLISLCWILPMALTLTASGLLSARNTRSRVSDIMTASVENTAEQAQRDLDQVVNDLLSMSYEPAIRQAYQAFHSGGGTYRAGLIGSTRTYLEQKFYRNELLNAVYVVFPGIGIAQSYDRSELSWSEAAQFSSTLLYQNAETYMRQLGTDVKYVYQDGRLYLVRLLTLQADSFSPYAMVVADLNTGNIFSGLRNLPWVTGITLCLGDSLLPVLEGADGWDGQPPAAGTEAVVRQNQLSVTAVGQANRYTFGYHITADLRPLMNEMGAGTLLILVIAVFSAALMGFVLYFFTRRVNRPIAQLGELAERIEQGDLGAQCAVDQLQSAEFMYLGARMNEMSAQLREQFERQYREELALRDAQIKALQSQINPHFLGNTLEIINWEARLAGNVKVSQMLEALSTLLHATQDRRQRPLVHLSEEMMYVNAYLFIIGARLGKRLQVNKQIDETLMDWYVPRLILQPILENAVEHGVSPRQRGVITIRAVREDDSWMRLEVENDSPMTREDEESVRRLLQDAPAPGQGAGNIGISNVNQRLLILYGERGALSIETVKNERTVSSMCIQNMQHPQENAT